VIIADTKIIIELVKSLSWVQNLGLQTDIVTAVVESVLRFSGVGVRPTFGKNLWNAATGPIDEESAHWGEAEFLVSRNSGLDKTG